MRLCPPNTTIKLRRHSGAMREHRTRNLEILVLTHHPGMTAEAMQFAHPTSVQVPTLPMADKPKKTARLRARLPRGLEDRGPAAINATRQMMDTIRAVYERYGFEPV